MNLHQGLRLLLFLLVPLSLATKVHAAVEEPLPLVEVVIPQDHLAPYKDRRENHGIYFAVGYEEYLPKSFISGIDALPYGDIHGTTSLPLAKLNIDYKYNASLGGLTLGADLGYGTINGSDASGERSLSVLKYGLGLKFVADMIFSEPYFVPYLGVTGWKMDLSETTTTASFSETTAIGYNYTVGFLFQLDWIDPVTAKEATFNMGMENTFLDVYLTQYASTGSVEEANMETDLVYGANLRFEF